MFGQYNLTKLETDTKVGLLEIVGDTMQSKRIWKSQYSHVSFLEAEKGLGVVMETLDNEAIPVNKMLASAGYTIDENNEEIKKTKKLVYKAILQYLDLEGYPTETNPDYSEINVSDLVLYILDPIVSYFKRRYPRVGRNIRLRRAKEIISDGEVSDRSEFVMMDLVSVTERYYVMVIETKKSMVGEAMGRCLLSMKNMRDSNGAGKVYGFVTTGESWQMLGYDGVSFQVTDKFDATFRSMRSHEEVWMKQYSVVVNCLEMALLKGGIVNNAVVIT